VLEHIDSPSFDEIRSALLERAKRYCPDWDFDQAGDPAVVWTELFAWLVEQSHFRLQHRRQGDLRALMQGFGLESQTVRGARAPIQLFPKDGQPTDQVRRCCRAGLALTPEGQRSPVFHTVEDVDLVSSKLEALLTIKDGEIREYDLSKPIQIFEDGRLTGSHLYLGDSVFGGLESSRTFTLTIAGAKTGLSILQTAPWEYWNGRHWQSLTVNRQGDDLRLDLDENRQHSQVRDSVNPALERDNLDLGLSWIRVSHSQGDLSIFEGFQQVTVSSDWLENSRSQAQLSNDNAHYQWSVPSFDSKSSLSLVISGFSEIDLDDTQFSLELVSAEHEQWLGAWDGEGLEVKQGDGLTLTLAQWSQDSGIVTIQFPKDIAPRKACALKLRLQHDYGEQSGALVEVLSSAACPWPESILGQLTLVTPATTLKRVLHGRGKTTLEPLTHSLEALKTPAVPTLYWGFDSWDPESQLSIYLSIHAHSMPSPDFDLSWEVWTGKAWEPICVRDTTHSLAESGILRFPRSKIEAREVGGQNKYWVRSRILRGSREATGRIDRIYENVVMAVEGQKMTDEMLGHGDGVAALSLSLKHKPVSVLLSVVCEDSGTQLRDVWEPVKDFLNSTAVDRHFVFDHHSGRLQFGDGRHGRIPDASCTIMVSYKTSFGLAGQVAARALNLRDKDHPFLGSGTNIVKAFGAQDEEETEALLKRAPTCFQSQDRAITRFDFERLAKGSSAAVNGAWCRVEDGVVIVCVLPKKGLPWTSSLHIQVRDFLDDRKLLTTQLKVEGPRWSEISVKVILEPGESLSSDGHQILRESLASFFDPYGPGPRLAGPWEPGAQIRSTDCLAYLIHQGAVEGLVGVELSFGTQLGERNLTLAENCFPTVGDIRIAQSR
jgi:hypothetical protein